MYLGDELVAEVTTPRTGKMTLTYRAELLDRLDAGTLVLSAALPLRPERFSPSEAAPFLEGLLPDGWARAGLERRFDVHRVDSFSLLAAVGRECAGAVSLVPQGEPWPPAPVALVGLDDDAVAARLAALEDDPFGVDDVTRVTLAGSPWKLPLTISPDGSWAAPAPGHPSTYLLRPEPPDRKGLVVTEAFALEVMRRAGMLVVDAEATTIAGRDVLVVRRYDRTIGPDGAVNRIHQEDCCQALGASRSERTERAGGPRLEEVAELVADLASDPEGDRVRLLEWVTASLVFGRVDGSARDLALIYHEDACALAPVASMAGTADYADRPRQLGQSVHGADDLDRVGWQQVVGEAGRWGMGPDDATVLVRDHLDRLEASLDGAREVADPGDDVVSACRTRIAALTQPA
ncbi:MAG: HipA domain-containing protein [Acidimicrobiales bacterium]